MKALTALIIVLAATEVHAAPRDRTAAALDRCSDDAANASTAGQLHCEEVAERAYDRRMNVAYSRLIGMLPRDAADRLRLSQRAWISFRDSETKAILGIYETRHGTMYAPMRADSEMNIVRDRALQLEGYVEMMSIEG